MQFSLFHNLNLGKASTNRKWYMYLAILWARSCQCHWVCDLIKKSPYGSRDGASFTFSEFGLRQSLDRRHVSFGNHFGWVLSISVCLQILYPTIRYGSRVMGNFQVFTVWTSAKPRPMNGQWYFATPWPRSCQYQWAREISSNYSIWFKK